MKDHFQVVIIGAGVVGTAIARSLSRYQLSVAVIEKEAEVGWGTSKANSGIVHAGFHSEPGTLKARFCVRGNELMGEICRELDVPFKRNGLLTVARDQSEIPTLEKYLAYGQQNGVPGMELISGEEARNLEPNLSEDIVAALNAPTAGVIMPFELAIAQEENARENGVEFFLNTAVTDLRLDGDNYLITTDKGTITADYVINAAGLFTDDIARMIDDDSFSIHPRKGEEYLMDKRTEGLVQRTIFPTPTPTSKGVLVIPTADGNIMIGPTAVELEEKDDFQTTPEGFREILSFVQGLVPALSAREIITSFAGLRAASDRHDFVIEESKVASGFIHVAGIESPGLTATPAIAEYVTELLRDTGLLLDEKDDYNPIRKPVVRFYHLSKEEKRKAIEANPDYAHVVCRCETVTEGEIVEAIRRGARTVDGVKFRTRAGAGRCQGGFCQPHVVRLLARELNISETEVTKRGGQSRLLVANAKELCQDDEANQGGILNVANN